jgi:hypothetical protein
MTDDDHVWQPMATTPRDRTLIIVKLAPGSLNRKRYEHIVSGDDGALCGVWRSHTGNAALLFGDGDCVGWRPLDDAGREFLKQRRERERDRRRARGKGPPPGSSSIE